MMAKRTEINTASDVAQYKKVRVRVLGRGARSKNKRQSPSVSLSGSSTNVLATRLERRMGTAQSNRTQGKVAHSRANHHQLLYGNWNVLTLTGKELELVEEAKKYHLDIVGISSTKRRGSGTVNLDGGWKLFYSGADPTMSAQAGVGILLSPLMSDCVSDWIPLGSRVCMLKLKVKDKALCLLQVYAPNATSEYQAFVDEVNDALLRVSPTESTVLMGDFNAHVGIDNETWKGVIGRHGDASFNENGRYLLQLCCSNGLCIMNTFFQHRNVHKYTWYRPSMGQKSLIDFCIVSADLFSDVLDVRVKRGAELSTDHHLVVCSLRFPKPWSNRKSRQSAVTYRIKWEALEEDKVRKQFASSMSSKFRQLPDVSEDVEMEWSLFKSAIISSAAECCGQKRLRVAAGSEKRTPWWNQDVKEAIRAKKDAFKALLQNRLSSDLQSRYSEARKAAILAVKQSKEKSWEEFGRRLDSDQRTANKVFWQTIRRLRGKKSNTTASIKDSEGNILSNENDILARWREYFKDLLNPVEATSNDTQEVMHSEEVVFTAAEVASAVRRLKSGKAAGEDEIRPEMLKAMNGEGILWLTRVCQVAWKLGKTPEDWQTGVIIPIFKKGDRKECTNYRGISLLSLPGKVYAKCLERKCREIVESKLEDGQCGFRPGRSTTDQVFTLRQVFEKSWEYAKDVFTCFVDLEKAYDRVPRDKLWGVLQEYGIGGQLLQAIKSFYCQSEVCIRVNGKRSEPFHVGIGLRQGCALSPLLFIIYMNWIDKRSQTDEGVTIGSCKISRLLFADDLVLLAATQSGLQRSLDSFAAACEIAGMKISTTKTEVLHLSRKPDQCSLHVDGVSLKQVEKFKYLGVAFTSDGKQDEEIDMRTGKASAVMRALHRSVVTKRELSKKAKLSVFKSIFIPILTYGHESWIMTERVRSQVQASEMRFLRRIQGVTMFDKVRSLEIRKSLQVEPLLLRIERSQLRWFGHVSRMPQERLPKQVLLEKVKGERPVGRPRTRWLDQMEDLAWDRLGLCPSEVKEVVQDRDVWRLNLEVLPPRPSRNKRD